MPSEQDEKQADFQTMYAMLKVHSANQAKEIEILKERLSTPPADAALADVLRLIDEQFGHAADVGAIYIAFTQEETKRIAAALRARAVPELYCVGRANYTARGGNVGRNWHVVGVADVPYRTCVPKNGELHFVLAASKAGDGGAG